MISWVTENKDAISAKEVATSPRDAEPTEAVSESKWLIPFYTPLKAKGKRAGVPVQTEKPVQSGQKSI